MISLLNGIDLSRVRSGRRSDPVTDGNTVAVLGLLCCCFFLLDDDDDDVGEDCGCMTV